MFRLFITPNAVGSDVKALLLKSLQHTPHTIAAVPSHSSSCRAVAASRRQKQQGVSSNKASTATYNTLMLVCEAKIPEGREVKALLLKNLQHVTPHTTTTAPAPSSPAVTVGSRVNHTTHIFSSFVKV